MTFSDDEDENLAQFLESEVLSEVSDKVFQLFTINFHFLFLIYNLILLDYRLGFWFGIQKKKSCFICY